VIAEGVEKKEELDCLVQLGCYHYQGYYFSHPIAFDKLEMAIKLKANKIAM